MDDPSLAEIGFKLALLFALVFANGFFVLSEFALVTVRKSWVEALVKKGHPRARTLLRVISDLDHYIAATQLGITIASIGLGWIGEPLLANLFRPVFEQLPSAVLSAIAAHTLATSLAFALITFLHVVLGELAPKTIALERTEKLALAVARPMVVFYYTFYPFIRLLNRAGLFFLRRLKLPPAREHRAMYAEEIQQMINLSGERGLLEAQATELITNVLGFTDTVVREVMRPRGEVTVVEVSTPVDDIVHTFAQTGYSRLPVYAQKLDNIIGILYGKDLLPSLPNKQTINIRQMLRAPLFLPDAASVGEALRQMRQSKTHFAIVVDEYGAFEGILTLEDLLEELVGEIRDEHDVEEEAPIVPQVDGSWLLDGMVAVREVNRRLHLSIPESDEYATIAGFLMSEAGRFPSSGDEVIHENLCFTVQQIRGRRIARVKLALLPPTPAPASRSLEVAK